MCTNLSLRRKLKTKFIRFLPDRKCHSERTITMTDKRSNGIAWLALALLVPVFGGSRSANAEISFRQKQIDQLLTNSSYDPRIAPNYDEDDPVVIHAEILILGIDSVSESNMDFSMTMFLRQRWKDSRLVYPPDPHIKSLELDTKVMEKVWVPDTYTVNEKEASFHDVTVPNRLMHIYPAGEVQYSLRITGTYSCEMDLQKYPMDTQSCSLVFESYGYSTQNLLLRWTEFEPVRKMRGLVLPQFDMENPVAYICDRLYYGVNYTCIGVNFKLVRHYGYYLTQIYIPTILIVSLSWVSFWLNIDAVPARISLGLLTVLTMTTQSAGARSNLPRVSYIKAIDVWMAVSLFFVFAALIEFAYINVLSRVQQRRRDTICLGNLPQHVHKNHEDEEKGDAPAEIDWDKKGKISHLFKGSANRERARTVDKLARIMFPLVFVMFNAVYWFFYIFWNPQETKH